MIAAREPTQRPRDAKLLVVDACGGVTHVPRHAWVDQLRRGDLVIANDAATIPASLAAVHERSGARIEVRLAGGDALAIDDVTRFRAILFGEGDYRTRTEDRAAPPSVEAGDRLIVGDGAAIVEGVLGHPRLVELRFGNDAWRLIARHGRPIQYAHMERPLALWDVWTPIAAAPVAFEPPSAGFALDWQSIARLKGRGIAFATITHAAGISSTGDATLDARLPFDEPYEIPSSSAFAIRRARRDGRRVIAIGTTVVRALESASSRDGRVRSGKGIARQRIGAGTRLRVVDAVLSGTHEPGSSHHELLRAFADEDALAGIDKSLEDGGYRTHEFGDSVLLERIAAGNRVPAPARLTGRA